MKKKKANPSSEAASAVREVLRGGGSFGAMELVKEAKQRVKDETVTTWTVKQAVWNMLETGEAKFTENLRVAKGK